MCILYFTYFYIYYFNVNVCILLILKGCVFFSQAKSPLFLLRSKCYRISTTKKAGGLAFCYFVAAAFLQVNEGQLFKLCVLYRKSASSTCKGLKFYTLYTVYTVDPYTGNTSPVLPVYVAKKPIFTGFLKVLGYVI